MNPSTIINNKEIDLLKSMIGKKFDKYKCVRLLIVLWCMGS